MSAFVFHVGSKFTTKKHEPYRAYISKVSRYFDVLPCETVASKIVASSMLYLRRNQGYFVLYFNEKYSKDGKGTTKF
jgi:hypothetical protein